MGWLDSARAISVMLGTCAGLAAATPAAAQGGSGLVPVRESASVGRHISDAERILNIHNLERARLGLPPLAWNQSLERDAGDYARTLLARGVLSHSHASERRGSGENLWMGTAGAWDSDAIVHTFLDERRYFREAAFPDISLTGNWTDVGHYSQIVWRETKEVGCALDSGNGKDVLVCRYFPAGNVWGKNPF